MKIFKLLILLLPNLFFAQIQIEGVVRDDKGVIAFANVIISDSSDNTIKGIISNEDGTFSIEMARSEQPYTIQISYLGYEDWKKGIIPTQDINLGNIVLIASQEELGEIVITSKKKVFERKVDRIVFNVENSLGVAGGDAINALKVAPGLVVKNDQIQMIGKSGMQVMLNGRLLPLSGNDLVSFLSTISADDIKKIEIITNPPSKYEAEGNSGIVNIVLKSGLADSWNNDISFSYTQAEFPVFAMRDNFSFQKDKFQILFNVSGSLGSEQETEDFQVEYNDSDWFSNAERQHFEDAFSTRFNLEYDLTEKIQLGTLYLLNFNQPGFEDKNITRIIDRTSSGIDSLLINNGFNDKETILNSLNVHTIVQIDTLGKELSVDLDYLTFSSDQDRFFETNSFDINNQFLNTIIDANNTANQNIESYSGKLDMEHPLKKFGLSYGGKITTIKNNSMTSFFNIVNGNPIIDPNQTDDFDYTENIQAGYISVSREFNEKWSGKLGFRFESTQTEGFSRVLNQTNTNNYNSLFPTAYLSFEATEEDTFYSSYGRRINRPSYFDLNPFRFYYDSNFFSEGNPFLRPSFTDNFEIGYVHGEFSTNIFYSKDSDGYGVVISASDDGNTRIVTRKNYFDATSIGLVVNYNKEITSWWETYNSLYTIHNESTLIDKSIDTELKGGLRVYATTTSSFVINKPKTLRAQINFWYNSAYKENLYAYSDSYGVDMAIRYAMLDNDLRMSLIFNDIFSTSAEQWTWEIDGIKQKYLQNRSFQNVRLALSYRFGNKDKRGRDRGFGNDDERDRL